MVSGCRSMVASGLGLLVVVTRAEPAKAEPANLTPCQKCCQPGGDCSGAYKNTPGKCCGTVNGQAFCCPGVIDGAKCYNCGSAYRCYSGITSRNICGGGTPSGGASHHHHANPHHHHYSGESEGSSTTGLMLMLGIGAVLAFIFCTRRQHDHHVEYPAYNTMMPQGKPVAYGAPVSGYAPQGAYGAPMMHSGMPGYGYGGGGGYSGTAVAGSAAAGFLGGMLVNEAMSHHGHHHSDSDYGGGYSSGGDYGGGGGSDFGGGGDSGFAADS